MIKVEMMQTDKGYSVAASGHADYAPKGQDIVCAAVSVLLQTLANKVEEAARQKQLESSCVQHGESFVVQAKPSGGMTGIMVAAWYDFVEEGLSELAGQYPDHVELYIYDDSDGCDAPEKALNLQKFAEGGDGGAGAAEGGAAEAEPPAVQAPALRPAQARLTQALANAYGVDTEDMDGLIEAVENGRVKDEKYYEDLAQQRGVSVKTARELDKMESDLKRSNTRNAQLQAMQQEAARQQRVSQIQAQWEAQAAQLKTQYPDFELQEVLANEQVADLMRRGVSLPDAYRAAYFDHIMQQATAQTAQKVEQGVAARIQQRAGRPGENGTRPGGAVTTHVDVASMSRRQLEDLERRARRGEKITL